MIRNRPIALLAIVAVLLVALFGGLAAAYSTHLAPDPEPCPVSLECFIMLNGTLIQEATAR